MKLAAKIADKNAASTANIVVYPCNNRKCGTDPTISDSNVTVFASVCAMGRECMSARSASGERLLNMEHGWNDWKKTSC